MRRDLHHLCPHPSDMGNDTTISGLGTTDEQNEHGSTAIERRPPSEASLFDTFGLARAEPTSTAISTRDSLDGLDPRMLRVVTRTRRVSSASFVVAKRAAPAYDDLAFADEVDSSDTDERGPQTRARRHDPLAEIDPTRDVTTTASLIDMVVKQRARNARGRKIIGWSLAFITSISVGAIAGKAAREHRASSAAAMTATELSPEPVAIAVPRVVHPQRNAEATRVAPPAPETAIDTTPPSTALIASADPIVNSPVTAPDAPVAATPRTARRVTRGTARGEDRDDEGSNGEDIAAQLRAAMNASAAQPAAANAAIAVAPHEAAVQAPAARANPPADACAARCNGDLACAANCVVNGAQPRAAEIPAAPAVTARAEEPTTTPAANALPQQPSRDEVRDALDGVANAMHSCAADDTRTAFVTVTFASSGRVTTAVAEAPYAGTPAGSCMARAARAMTVSPFSRANFSVRAPFSMR